MRGRRREASILTSQGARWVDIAGRRGALWARMVGREVEMTTIDVAIPDGVFSALRKSPLEVARDIRIAAAVDWFAKGLVSQGKAAELAGVSRWEFLEELGRRHVPAINITVDDLEEELRGSLGEK